jgi:YD repeat-containing protein
MRRSLLAALLLLPLAARADQAPPAPEAQATPQTTETPSQAPLPEAGAQEAPRIVAAPPVPEPPGAPLSHWSLNGFLNGRPATLSQTPSQGTWHIRTGASEIVLVPARREASMAGHPLPWPDLPLAPSGRAPLQPGPEMADRGCRFWVEETPAGTHAWCWDAQRRPLRILTREGEQWRLVFDATTRESAPLWRLLRAVGG